MWLFGRSSHSLMWSPWQETNSRSFEGSEQSILELMSFFFYSLFDWTLALQSFSCFSLLFMLIVTWEVKGMFANVVLVTLFKCCVNMCRWKSVVEIRVVLFKQRKLLFKQRYQIDPNYCVPLIYLPPVHLGFFHKFISIKLVTYQEKKKY